MSYKIIETDGTVRTRRGQEVYGSAVPDQVVTKRILDKL
jgi:hypothetical protein